MSDKVILWSKTTPITLIDWLRARWPCPAHGKDERASLYHTQDDQFHLVYACGDGIYLLKKELLGDE